MIKTTKGDGSQKIRFDLRRSTEYNFNLYQDAIEDYPDSGHMLKLRFDQYIKVKPLHDKDQTTAEPTEIEFQQLA